MTRWQFSNGSTVQTVANSNSNVTYEVTLLSIDHTGVYYCEAIIDGMVNTSMNYTLFGEYVSIGSVGITPKLHIIYDDPCIMLLFYLFCLELCCIHIHHVYM